MSTLRKVGKNISIVTCVYNGWQYTHQLLGDIKTRCHDVGEVVVVNNGSEDIDVAKGLEFWKKSGALPLKRIHLEKNLGFSGGFNKAIQSATKDIVIAISNDVRIYSYNFLEYVYNGLEGGTCIVGARLLSQNTGWNTFGLNIIPYLEGWLLAAKAEDWENLGYFDERYGMGDFEDVDLSMTATKMGYDLAELPVSTCEHLGARTFGYNPERAERTVHNRELFKEKWNL